MIDPKKALTDRQYQVFKRVLRGMTNFDIGYELGIYDKGVKWHLTNIYKILGVKSRAEMIVKYLNPAAPIEKLAEQCHAVKHETGPSGTLNQ